MEIIPLGFPRERRKGEEDVTGSVVCYSSNSTFDWSLLIRLGLDRNEFGFRSSHPLFLSFGNDFVAHVPWNVTFVFVLR